MRIGFLMGVACLALAACGGDDNDNDGDSDGPTDAVPMDGPTADADLHEFVVDSPAVANRNLDLLFVIDDSQSMQDKQNNLAANFPNFINVLTTLSGGLPDVHIGVVTTDMGVRLADGSLGTPVSTCTGTGKNGELQTSGAAVSGKFISDVKMAGGGRVTNYSGDLATVFSTMAKVGGNGCGFEEPFAAMASALSNNPANAGFLRTDALLGVVFVTDEDDCSPKADIFVPDNSTLGPLQSFRCTRFGVTCDEGGADSMTMNQVGTKGQCHPATGSPYLTDVAPYVTFLKGLKSDLNNIIVAGISGTTDPFAVELRAPQGSTTALPALAHSCTYVGGDGLMQVADPPVRLKYFLDQFPNRSTFTTICQPDLSGGLAQVAQLMKRSIGDVCIESELEDVDANTAGDQYDCIVEDVSPSGSTQVIAPCDDMPTGFCWSIGTDAAQCPSAEHHYLKINNAPTGVVGERYVARCLIED